MNQSKALESITRDWQKPGTHLIVSDAAQTGSFWQQLRTTLPSSTLLAAPNTLAECASWVGQLSQSFLGQQGVYWIVLPTPWAPKAKKEVIRFLNSYSGPHALWLVGDDDLAQALKMPANNRYVVAAELKITQLSFLTTLFKVPRAQRALEQAGITRLMGSISLNAAVSVVNHAEYVPMRKHDDAQRYLQRLMPNHSSLVGLADLFFQQKWSAFLKAWQRTAGQYSDMFWVAFWAEQCWRAYWVCYYQRNRQTTRARSMAYRLPTAFINSYWKKQSPKKLQNMFEQLSFFDTRVKKGSSFTLSELLTITMNAERMQ